MEILIFIFIIYIIYKKSKDINKDTSSHQTSLFQQVLKIEQFSNLKNIGSSNGYKFYTADHHGENYLFAEKINSLICTANDVEKIYFKAAQLHLHNIAIIYNGIVPTTTNIAINKYGIELWNTEKLKSCLEDSSFTTTVTKSVLKTSNTSYDKCKIESSVDPIQKVNRNGQSLFSNLFHKPNRL